MQNARGPNSGPIDFREPSGETVGLHHHRRQFHAPLRPSSSFREGSPRNLNIRHPSARTALPADCTFGIFRPPCTARSRSRSLRAWNTRMRYFAVVISLYGVPNRFSRDNATVEGKAKSVKIEEIFSKRKRVQYFCLLSNLNVRLVCHFL